MLGLGLDLAGRARGWVAGRLLGCSCYLGLGSAAPAPGFLGTQSPCATQALIYLNSTSPYAGYELHVRIEQPVIIGDEVAYTVLVFY